jgi:hypothetical protein
VLIPDETPNLSARGSVHLVAEDMNFERVAKTRKLNHDDFDPIDTRRLPAGIRTHQDSILARLVALVIL